MSSDESDIDQATNQPRYTVVKPDWRHADLHNWLKVLDQLHHRAQINNWSRDKRGALAHIRVGSQRVHKKAHAPPHLPINAYDPLWLESRETLYIKHVLYPEVQPYDFTHSSDVITYVLSAIASSSLCLLLLSALSLSRSVLQRFSSYLLSARWSFFGAWHLFVVCIVAHTSPSLCFLWCILVHTRSTQDYCIVFVSKQKKN